MIAAAFVCLCLCDATAQVTKPLTVWVDSVRMNVCGSKSFQTAIRAASFRPGDTVVGFRPSDNVASATLYVTWDPVNLRLDDLVITSGTMSEGIRVTSRVISGEYTLEIIIADDRQPFGTLKGALPIVYINGTVIAPDTVAPPYGWIQVTDVELTSDTRFEPETYRPGYVRVERDTSTAYTGRLRLGASGFDTLRLDTITMTLENVRQRRVREVSFELAVDTSFFVFEDTLQSGTLAAQPGTTVELVQQADTIRGRFVAASDLSQEGPLLKFILRRTTDSAFAADVTVVNAAINENSCLGRFLSFGAPVTASAIVRDTVSSAAPELDERNSAITIIPAQDGNALTIRSSVDYIDGIDLFDALGRRIDVELLRTGPGNDLRLVIDAHAAGPYIVQLRIGQERISKQFIFIK